MGGHKQLIGGHIPLGPPVATALEPMQMHITLYGDPSIQTFGEDLLAYCVNADLNFCNVDNNQHSELKRVTKNLSEPVCVGPTS